MAQSQQFKTEQCGNLFPLATRFRIVQLRDSDAKKGSDELFVLKQLIIASEDMYPSIGKWFENKVVPGLRTAERIAYVAYEDETPIASAVLKNGDRAKFCHLKIHKSFQDMELGQMFFTQMTLEARHFAKEIHFTLPESLWASKRKFFETFGFENARVAGRQYRNGDSELRCSAPFTTVWSAALNKLPLLLKRFSPAGLCFDNRLLISIKPTYAQMILRGAKLVEVRKRFSRRWIGSRAVLYASRPLGALVGEATINRITIASPSEIWTRFSKELGCSSVEFEQYVGSASEVSALELSDVTPYRSPISLSQVSHLIKEDLRPPQSFSDLRLDDDSPWMRAASVASLLHGRFGYLR